MPHYINGGQVKALEKAGIKGEIAVFCLNLRTFCKQIEKVEEFSRKKRYMYIWEDKNLHFFLSFAPLIDEKSRRLPVYKKESYGEKIKVFSVKDNTQSNPSLTGKVSFAMKSCFAGVRLDEFDFYRRLVLWISSE